MDRICIVSAVLLVTIIWQRRSKHSLKSISLSLVADDQGDIVLLPPYKFQIPSAQDLIAPGAIGAFATFEGTTRDSFQGKQVTALEYEAYETMAIQILFDIIKQTKVDFPDLLRVCIIHRLGSCPVGETSLFIATMSSHRKPALDALPIILDRIKTTVPIWKLEHYADDNEPPLWKENIN